MNTAIDFNQKPGAVIAEIENELSQWQLSPEVKTVEPAQQPP